jgi:hypothetical protein
MFILTLEQMATGAQYQCDKSGDNVIYQLRRNLLETKELSETDYQKFSKRLS